MSRTELVDLPAGTQGWDGVVNDDLAILRDGPMPIKEYADYTALSAVNAALYDRCLAVTASPPMLWISTGGAWVPTGINVKVMSSGALAGANYTFAGAFPAGCRQIGVAGRITTTITGDAGPTTLEVGDHGSADPNRYATALALAAGTTFADVATADPGGWNAAARDVVVALAAGNFTAGVLKIYVFYVACFAPLS